MKSGRQANADASGEVFPEPRIGRVDEFAGGAIEDDPAFIQDEKLGAVVDAAVGDWFYLSGLLVKAVSGEEEGVLQAMGDDQRCCVSDVALLDDKINDGG